MLYMLYCSVGNTDVIEEYLAYFEIDEDGYFVRYLEISSDGIGLRYTQELPADSHGQLPEGRWDPSDATRKEFGSVVQINRTLFEAVWRLTKCANAADG